MHDTFHLAAEVINQMSLPLLHSSLSSPFSSEDKRAERSGNTGAYRMMTTTTTATMRRRRWRWRQRRDGEMIKRRWISCQPEFKVVLKKKNAQESSEPAEERRVQSASDSINFNQQEDENWKKNIYSGVGVTRPPFVRRHNQICLGDEAAWAAFCHIKRHPLWFFQFFSQN